MLRPRARDDIDGDDDVMMITVVVDGGSFIVFGDPSRSKITLKVTRVFVSQDATSENGCLQHLPQCQSPESRIKSCQSCVYIHIFILVFIHSICMDICICRRTQLMHSQMPG